MEKDIIKYAQLPKFTLMVNRPLNLKEVEEATKNMNEEDTQKYYNENIIWETTYPLRD